MELVVKDLSLGKRVALIIIFIVLTPIAISTSFISLNSLSKDEEKVLGQKVVSQDTTSRSGVRIFASLPSSYPSISSEIEEADARVEIIRQYLTNFNSPLKSHAETIIETADEYGLDYRLTTAIAQQESNLCKNIPAESYNCWGWGIHSRGTLGFASYDDAIAAVSRGIREEYIDKGYTNVEEIMEKYTPLSEGSWAYGVNKFMNQMK
jgi:hypothetical protein